MARTGEANGSMISTLLSCAFSLHCFFCLESTRIRPHHDCGLGRLPAVSTGELAEGACRCAVGACGNSIVPTASDLRQRMDAADQSIQRDGQSHARRRLRYAVATGVPFSLPFFSAPKRFCDAEDRGGGSAGSDSFRLAARRGFCFDSRYFSLHAVFCDRGRTRGGPQARPAKNPLRSRESPCANRSSTRHGPDSPYAASSASGGSALIWKQASPGKSQCRNGTDRRSEFDGTPTFCSAAVFGRDAMCAGPASAASLTQKV
jgi:hypothetical protein